MKAFKLTLFSLIWLLGSGSFLLGQSNLVADFTYAPQPPCAGQAVSFSDASTGGIAITNYNYDFGDGNWSSTGTPSVTHTYANAGTYNVWYCVWDSATWDSSCVSKTIVVQAGPCLTPDSLRGVVYYDVNSNSTYDAGTDFPVRGKVVNVGTFGFMTDANGEYLAILNAGTYSASLASPAPYTVASPTGGSHSFVMPGNGSNFTGDFALSVANPIQDLRVTIYNGWAYRPGRNTTAMVVVENVGTIPMSGSAVFTYDDTVAYVSSSMGTTHNAANQEVSNSFTGLGPSQFSAFHIVLKTDTAAPLGTPVTNTAVVNPINNDANTYDNYTSATDTVRASYDPNDKQVTPGFGPQGYVLPTDELTFRIRFQNTGTDTAFDIYLIDTLDANLDINSLEMLASSHNYTLSIGDLREVRWQFDNILLPDSNVNEALSHGYVMFKIKPVAALPDFTEIKNFADIYFDFNAPVRTNTTLTTINRSTGIIKKDFVPLTVSPNPTSGLLQVAFDLPHSDDLALRVVDVQGRTVLVKRLGQLATGYQEIQLNMETLNAGIYMLQISSRNINASQKVIIMK